MTKFKDIEYKRPDFDAVIEELNTQLDKLETAETAEDFFATHEKVQEEVKDFMEMYTVAYIRNTIDTRDEFYDEEINLFYENLPRLDEVNNRLQKIRLASPHREAFEDKYGTTVTAKDELQKDIFKPEIMEDRVQESKLANEYQKLTGGAKIKFRGEEKNLAQMTPFTQSVDRNTRKEAFEALNGWFADNKETLDQLYDDLVKVRQRIAEKLGFDNYIPVAYKAMGRLDWDAEDAKRYRQQIVDYVVPLTQKYYKEQAERIGIEDFKYYDVPLKYLSGNPKPVGEEAELVEAASQMYSELSPETDDFFKMMRDQELMDLTTKEGKAPGGYMTWLSKSGVPFIFSNFNGTSGDVDVLTHEAGHAFNGYETKDIYPMELSEAAMEIMETHSMAMEFFTHPWMDHFFGEDTEKYYHSHVIDGLNFLPYGASIDEFQEFVYENPEATPDERNAKYREIEKKYLPHIDYAGNEYLESGARWQRQLHVYQLPFYYLDYTLAQVNAYQYFIWDREDHNEAWNSYLNLCRLGGTYGTKKTLEEVGLDSPFEDGSIAKITPKLEDYLNELDYEKIK